MSFLKNKLFKNASIYIVMAFIQKSISFFLIPFYTAFLSPSEFGIVNQTIAIGTFYVLILTYALDEAAARFYFEFRNSLLKKQKVLGTIIILSSSLVFVGSLILLFFNKYTYRFFVPEIPSEFIILSIIIILFSPINSIYQKILRIKEDAKRYSILMLGYSLTQIILSVIFLWFIELNALGYILAISMTSVAFGIYSIIKLKSETDFNIDKTSAYQSLKYSTSIVPHTISSWGLRSFTIIAVGKYLSSALVGVFSAVNFIAVIINVLSKAILDAYQPWVYRKLESGKLGVKNIIVAARLLGLLFVTMGFFLSLFSKEFIQIFINKQYHSGIYITPILVFGSIVLVLGSLLVFVLYYYKKSTKYIAYSTLSGTSINVFLSFILIPKFGLMGAALSLAFANLVISVLKQIFASKTLDRNVLFIDIYLIAILNLIISYISIKFNFSVLNKAVIFIVELILVGFFYRSIISLIIKLMDNSRSSINQK